MTIGEAIGLVDRLTYNQVENAVKVGWLSNLDGMLHTEICKVHAGSCEIPFKGYDGGTEPDTVLLVPAPYDEIYRWYLEMQIHDVNGEIVKYNNAAQKFNGAMLSFADFVNRTCTPLGTQTIRLV